MPSGIVGRKEADKRYRSRNGNKEGAKSYARLSRLERGRKDQLIKKGVLSPVEYTMTVEEALKAAGLEP